MTAIIDCHTHCFPPEAAADPRNWAIEKGELQWADLVDPQDRPSIQDWATPGEMLNAMDRAGIEKAVLLGWYWENIETCLWHNRFMADWMQVAPDRFIAFAAFQPACSEKDALNQLNKAEDLGMCGLGELHSRVQNFSFDSIGWLTAAKWAVNHNWPVNFHVTELVGCNHPGNIPTPLNNFVQLGCDFPDLKIILAHWGGGLPFFELNPKIRSYLSNVYYDTAASPLLYDPVIFRHVIDIVGADRVLFGTDYPLKFYPPQKCDLSLLSFIRSVKEKSRLNSNEIESIMHKNAVRLLF